MRLLLLVVLLGGLLPLSTAARAATCAEPLAALEEARRDLRHDDAIAAAERLLACPAATPAERAAARYAIGWGHLRTGQADLAREAFEALLADGADELLDTTSRSNLHTDLARYFFSRNEIVRAIPLQLDAIRIGATMPVPWRVQRQTLLAQMYQRTGALDLAEQAAREGARIAEEGGNASELVRARHMTLDVQLYRWTQSLDRNPARLEAMLGRLGEMERTLTASEATVPPAWYAFLHFLVADLRSRTLYYLGRREEALAAARAALAAAERTPRTDARAGGLLLLGSMQLATGRTDEAAATLEQTRALLPSAPVTAVLVYEQLGSLARAQGRRDDALAYFQTAHDLHAASRLQMGATAWTALSMDSGHNAHRALLALHLEAGDAPEALRAYDFARAHSLQNSRWLRARRAADPELDEQLQAVQQRLSEDHGRLLAGESTQADFRRQLLDASAELLLPELGAASAEALDVRALQRRLARDGRVLVAYHVGDRFHRDPSVAFVVRADTIVAVPLNTDMEALTAMVARLPRPGRDDTWLSLPPEPLRALYETVFAPIAALVPEGRPVTIVPDGPLLEVPFALLLTGPAQPGQYRSWPYLARRHALSTELAPSLLLPASTPPRRASRPLLAFGRTTFEQAPSPDLAVVLRSSGGALPHLPSVRTELAALRRHAPRGTFALDADATPSRLLDAIGDARVVHLASHVRVSSQPLYSSLLLSPADASDPRSGDLYFFDLLDRDLAADLVVLSGCDSAHGEGRLGEGLMGLHFAFRAAGATSTLGTLWPVDDAAMATLMDTFYRHLRRGVPTDEALRRAQLAFLDTGGALAAHPMLWGGLVLSGSPVEVDLGGFPRGLALLALGVLAAALVGGFLLLRARRRAVPA